jgi:hypothetical protein
MLVRSLTRVSGDRAAGARSFVRRQLMRILTRCIAAAVIFSGAGSAARGASLVVKAGGQTISPGTTLYLTTVPSMPNLVLSVSGGTSCDVFSYTVYVQYTDQAGHQTAASYTGMNNPGDQPSTVDWFNYVEGGTVTITWQLDGINGPNFGLFIYGTNPSPSTVDANLVGGPWFIQNLVAWESRAWSLAPAGKYKQYDAFGHPLWGTPDGIGLMQLEPDRRHSLDEDYWVYQTNITDGFAKLSDSKSGAYANWTNEYADMASNTGGNLVAANWPSDCETGANGAVCGGFGPKRTFFCGFDSGSSNGSPEGFGDGNWLHAYNGSYFVDWVDGTQQIPGHWEYDVQGPNNGYVYNVCTSPPL